MLLLLSSHYLKTSQTTGAKKTKSNEFLTKYTQDVTEIIRTLKTHRNIFQNLFMKFLSSTSKLTVFYKCNISYLCVLIAHEWQSLLLFSISIQYQDSLRAREFPQKANTIVLSYVIFFRYSIFHLSWWCVSLAGQVFTLSSFVGTHVIKVLDSHQVFLLTEVEQKLIGRSYCSDRYYILKHQPREIRNIFRC